MSTRKKGLFVALLNFFILSAGYIWLGRYRRALLCLLIASLCVGILGYFVSPAGCLVGVTGSLLLRILTTVDAYKLARAPKEESTRPPRWYISLPLIVFVSFLLFGIRSASKAWLVEFFKISSMSSAPTLLPGDYVACDKRYFSTNPISRGDVVVIRRDTKHVVARVVGLPNEVIEVNGTKVLVDGVDLYESYSRWSEGGSKDGNFGPTQVPPNGYFLMGDNRDHSKDSRFWENPFVTADYIEGKLIYIYFSFNGWDRIGKWIHNDEAKSP